FNLVLSSLFPDLQKNLAYAVGLAQRMNNAGIDSCAASSALAGAAVAGVGAAWKGVAAGNEALGGRPKGPAARGREGGGEALQASRRALAGGVLGAGGGGKAENWLEASMGVCGSAEKVLGEIEDALSKAGVPEEFSEMTGNP